MEVVVKSIDEFIKLGMKINNGDYVSILVDKDNLTYKIVIQQAKCEVLRGMYMDIGDAVEVFIEGDNLLRFMNTIVPSNMLKYYLEILDKCVLEKDVYHTYLLMKKQLKVDDIILFDDGRRGKILDFDASPSGQIMYKIIKKDGSPGARNFTLYGNYKYTCEDREFIDYGYLKLRQHN